jgi:hypothetical protein
MHWSIRVVYGTLALAGALLFAACGSFTAAKQAAYQTQSKNNLKLIGMGMLQHVDAMGKYPSAFSTDADGKPLLSWRVHILPFIEQNTLYKQFHLDEPWDSEHNKALLSQMPEIYRFPSDEQPSDDYTTRYVALVHPDGVFTGDDTKIGVSDLLDGTVSTVLVVEGNPEVAVPWTKPEDIDFDPQTPLAGLGGAWPNGFNALFAAGRVTTLRTDIPPETMKALVTRKRGDDATLQ